MSPWHRSRKYSRVAARGQTPSPEIVVTSRRRGLVDHDGRDPGEADDVGMDDAEADPGGHAGVDGVAPRLEDAVCREGRQRVASGDRVLRAQGVGAERVRRGRWTGQGRWGGAATPG